MAHSERSGGYSAQGGGRGTTISLPDENLFHGGLAALPDGAVALSGCAYPNPDPEENRVWARGLILKLRPSGEIDPSFGDGGYVEVTGGPGQGAGLSDMQLDPQGRLVVLGGRFPLSGPGPRDSLLVRLTQSGQLDPGFGSGGIAAHPTGDRLSPSTLTIDSTGRLGVSGSLIQGEVFSTFAARYLGGDGEAEPPPRPRPRPGRRVCIRLGRLSRCIALPPPIGRKPAKPPKRGAPKPERPGRPSLLPHWLQDPIRDLSQRRYP